MKLGHLTRISIVAVAAITPAVATRHQAGAIAPSTVDAPVREGDVVIVEPDDVSNEITSGNGSTEFTLRLPSGAACPGDSANDEWRVQTFLVPATDDPGTLHYGEIGPDGDGLWSLYDVATRAYVHGNTEPNAAAGSPGRIGTLPAFSFAVFPPGTLPPGTYRVGVACSLFAQTARYWDTEMTLAADPGDEPAELTWRVVDTPDAGGGSGGAEVVILATGAVVLVGALGFVFWRRARPSLRLSKETP